jgi:hypothetical protein
MTPPPPGDGPSPLVIGTRFVKQYYKVLSTTPGQIHRFYQPISTLSQGQGSDPTQPELFESLQKQNDAAQLKERFVLAGYEDCPVRFEFERGAIDAQLSVNGGVLLVVTGHIVYLRPVDEEEEEEDETIESLKQRRKAFVHTFFLGSMSSGTKRSYYVHNDVLRFLYEEEAATIMAPVVEVTKMVEVEPTVVVAAEPEPVKPTNGVKAAVVEAPSVSVEEIKEPVEVAIVEIKLVETAPVKEVEEAPGGGVEETKEETPEVEAAPKPPGSWASLVASRSTPSTPSRSAPATKPSPAPAPAPATPKRSVPPVAVTPTVESSTTTAAKPESSNKPNRSTKRDPDCTLVIKNIDATTTEAEVLGLFEPFAAATSSKIIGTTVSGNRGIAFVDYDTATPVLEAVEQHGKEPMQLRGRVLEMYQKTLEHRSRRGGQGSEKSGGRGGFRGGGGQGGQLDGGYRGGGGGRQQHRRGGGGRGGGGRGGTDGERVAGRGGRS